MASLRNAIPQRPYRERDQPQARSRHGLLEKHKDYSARARDYNAKKARLKALRQKASNRNEDEFHFGMMSSKSKGGVKIGDRGNQVLSLDVAKLLKTQDAGYLRTVLARTRRERERLETAIQIREDGPGGPKTLTTLKGGGKQGKHTVFVEDEEELDTFDPESFFQTDKAGLEKAYNRPRRGVENIEDESLEPDADNMLPLGKQQRRRSHDSEGALDAQKRMERAQDQMQVRLEALKTREQQLRVAEEQLDRQRARMSHSVGSGTNSKGLKFKVKERKR